MQVEEDNTSLVIKSTNVDNAPPTALVETLAVTVNSLQAELETLRSEVHELRQRKPAPAASPRPPPDAKSDSRERASTHGMPLMNLAEGNKKEMVHKYAR